LRLREKILERYSDFDLLTGVSGVTGLLLAPRRRLAGACCELGSAHGIETLGVTMFLMEVIGRKRLELLRNSADEARRMHYAPYSEFLVLAAVESVDGKIYSGANVEIVNYSLTKHAEEVAILTAMRSGASSRRKWLKTLYVAGAAPCGSCRQFALEFARTDAICVFERLSQSSLKRRRWPRFGNDDETPQAWRLSSLLPEAFEL
jgi:cytidine deaminase